MIPESTYAPWQTQMRGAKINRTPFEVMVDIDEVFMPLMDAIHDLAFERGLHDGSVHPSWKGWETYGCSEEIYWDLWSDFALAEGYIKTPPYPGSVEALRRLYWEGHTIHLVTARGFMNHASEIREWTPRWIEEWGIPWHSLTFHQDKVAAQDLLGVRFDYALDDSPKNFSALVNDGVKAYLMNHHHNAELPLRPRVHSVDEFVDIILEENA